jgi:hypothetical protein
MANEYSPERLRKMEKAHKQTRRMGKIIAFIAGAGWLLFLYKISQTSEAALRYSRAAHEEMGRWQIGLLIITALAVGYILLARFMGRKLERVRDERKASLRNQLDSASENERARIESELREMGA